MATDAENIATIKSQTLAIIAEITASPQPSYNVDGREWKWSEYLKELRETVAWCDAQLNAAAPYEIVSRACT